MTVSVEKASEKDALGESLITMKDALISILGQMSESVEQVADGAERPEAGFGDCC